MSLAEEGTPGARAVTVTGLEMLDPSWLTAARMPSEATRLSLTTDDVAAVSRDFYLLVGGPWWWVDRLGWTDQQWREWVDQPGHELWTLTVVGTDGTEQRAGYFELVRDADGDVLLAYFGLVPGFEGRGLGGYLLTEALRRAWQLSGATRVWVHTCDLDGPAALPNYLARGLRVFTTWTEHRMVPGAAG